jgi:4-hydroxybenzoate polyprenyltransferase
MTLNSIINITRLNKPIGILLLLWPTYWALWLSAQGMPSIKNIIIFTLGVILMRSAGCVINDLADRRFDGLVTRTKDRPLIVGSLSSHQAIKIFTILIFLSFLLVLNTNTLTIKMSFIALFLASLYPFMKRHTHLPQLVLGAAFSWSIPMAFSAETNSLPSFLWALYIINLLWTVAYDTMYAMVDREDDIQIGVKSTAILFGRYDTVFIVLLHTSIVIGLLLFGVKFHAGWAYYCGITLVSLGLLYLSFIIRNKTPKACFQAFKFSHWIGFVIWLSFIVI